MGNFESIGSARMSGGGVYFLQGNYIVEVEKAFQMKSFKNADLVIVECKIVESDVPERAPGTRASWVPKINPESMGSIKQFLAAANGIDPSDDETVNKEITPQVAELSFVTDSPLCGTKLGLQCVNVKTKAGGDFTKHVWSAIPAE
jgi:hypothetical protein